ncbi:enoyl-CoA hydratase/isomerase family protein [Bythopirellula polymerisocia]|uniref:Putative enoyl-CoA hydratase echA8 n=1 Tax=Bythopirellula polymerisocia TaxID=2528003 RepID=A0A5C6CRS8_9BACT|nr:enoyl-CoA hydratase/isomerase family protein [Bythopirellula polymerisocia]TWU25826.1 putative enoyl-CoA hydratase echA8 [Bythopirellula polymerisocia]
MYMPSEHVEVKLTDNVGTLILNRPDHGNALSRRMVRQLIEAIEDLYREKRVRAIILIGAGDTFCAGNDLEEISDACSLQPDWDSSQERWGEDAADFRELIARMLETPKPIIAAVNGAALSHGAGLVLACDIVVGCAESTFGLPDPRRGIVAGVVAPLLCHRLSAGHAARLLLTSSIIDAIEAARLGIFHELVDGDKVWARAVELGRECAEGAPEAVQLTKRILNETVGEQLDTQLTAGAILQATSFTTEAAQEGIAAFLEERKPEWK